jgi:hypothetical protein
MPSTREASAIAKKQLAIRDMHWPNAQPWLWDRKSNKGFATIPKTMPLILKIMDEMTNRAPVSATYLALWCQTWDNSFVVINRPGELAYASGFSGQRDQYTWSGRMKKLQELHFIDIKPGAGFDLKNVLIFNPHFVLRYHHAAKTPGLIAASYNTLMELAFDIGAKDMLEETPLPPAPFVPATA